MSSSELAKILNHLPAKRKNSWINSPSISPNNEKITRVSSGSFSSPKKGWSKNGLTFYNYNSGSFSNSSGGLEDKSTGCHRTVSDEVHDELQCQLFKLEDIGSQRSKYLQTNGLSLENSLSFGVAESNGQRRTMEDRHELIPFTYSSDSSPLSDLEGSPNMKALCLAGYAFFAIYDGHGGTQCADYVKQYLHDNIANQHEFAKNPEEAIRKGILQTDHDFLEKALQEGIDGLVGTTLCVVIIGKNTLYIGNVGDSEAIMYRSGGKIISLTKSHTPKNENERQRIQQCGGILVNDRVGHPVWNPDIINIALTRAMGNMYFKSAPYVQDKNSGLIAEPEVAKVELTTEDQFIILASDGFWDVVTPEEACSYVNDNKGRNPTIICKELTCLANRKQTIDNTTVLLINLTASNPCSIHRN